MKQVWQRLRAELVEIIEWSDAVPGAPSPDGDTLAWRFDAGGDPGRSRAIRNGAQLIVREGQWAVFLDEGRIADGFGPGRHTLSTANLPLLTNLLCLPSGFESPFKAEVVFVATRLFSDLKWGTRQPLLLRDPELGPVRLRGFGSYSLRVNDPAWLVREVGGASGRVDLGALENALRSLIVSRLADVLGRCDCPVFDLCGRYEWLARDLRLALLEEVQQYGLEIPALLIEGLTLPPEVEAAMVQRNVRLAAGEPRQTAPGPQPAGPTSPRTTATAALTGCSSSDAAGTPTVTAPEATAQATPIAGRRAGLSATVGSPAVEAPVPVAMSAAAADRADQPLPRQAPPPPPPLPGMARWTPPKQPPAAAGAELQRHVRDTSIDPLGTAADHHGTPQPRPQPSDTGGQSPAERAAAAERP